MVPLLTSPVPHPCATYFGPFCTPIRCPVPHRVVIGQRLCTPRTVGRPQGDKDVAQEIARALADIAGQLASLDGEANAWLIDPNFNSLKPRLNEGRSLTRGCENVVRRKGARRSP